MPHIPELSYYRSRVLIEMACACLTLPNLAKAKAYVARFLWMHRLSCRTEGKNDRQTKWLRVESQVGQKDKRLTNCTS